jgi:Flp pilus assembly protein TadD
MVAIIHEVGWRIAVFCLFVGSLSLYSLLTLLPQTAQERDKRIRAERNSGMGSEDEGVDPVYKLGARSDRSSLLPRYLLMAMHALIVVSSLSVGLPTVKSALSAHRAEVAFAKHNYEDAANLYKSALAGNAYASYLNAQYQEALAQRNANGGGFGDKLRMAKLHPENEAGHNDLGNALIQRGDPANAIKEYKLAVSLQPDDPMVHNNLGNALQAARRYPESIVEFRRALELDPGQIPTYYNLANTLMANNQIDEAVKYYHRAIEKNPKLAPAYYNLAQALDKQGKRAEAITALGTFLQLGAKQHEFADVVDKAIKQITEWRSTR